MKQTILLITFAILSSSAFAADIPKACYSKAAKAVVNQAEANYYDKDGVYALDCVLAANKAAVVCDMVASKGEGAASDSFIVVLNKTCSNVLRVQMTGEE